jgi:hypothetical protein
LYHVCERPIKDTVLLETRGVVGYEIKCSTTTF